MVENENYDFRKKTLRPSTVNRFDVTNVLQSTETLKTRDRPANVFYVIDQKFLKVIPKTYYLDKLIDRRLVERSLRTFLKEYKQNESRKLFTLYKYKV